MAGPTGLEPTAEPGFPTLDRKWRSGIRLASFGGKRGFPVRRWCVVVLVLGLAALLAIPTAGARILPRDAKPMGVSLKLWTVTYLRAAVQRPVGAGNSLLVSSNGKCGSAFGKVWFLPDAAPPDELVTHCVIPRGKLLFVPGAYLIGPATLQGIEQALTNRRFLAESRIWVDGRLVGSGHYLRTPVFDAVFPLHNVFGAPPGPVSAIASGYFAILSPLSPGQHTVVQNAAYHPAYGAPAGASSFTYHLTIR